ncbi:hypothetical protein CsSME_00023658 [Camellia sinensis var. sinensis]
MDTYSSGEDLVIKTRKPYTITKQRERWTEEEHNRFLEALKLYGRAWQRIEEHIGTKTAVQIRSHAQKFFTKLEKEALVKGVPIRQAIDIEIPPPRPKRKPSNPYPRKTGVATPSLQVGAKDGNNSSSVSSSCTATGKQILDLEREPLPEQENAKENQDEGNFSEVLTLFQEAPCTSLSSVDKDSIRTLAAPRNSCTFREFVPMMVSTQDETNESYVTVEPRGIQKLVKFDAKQTVQDNGTNYTSNLESSIPSHEKLVQGKKTDEMCHPENFGALPSSDMQATHNYPRHVPVHVLNGSLGMNTENEFMDALTHSQIQLLLQPLNIMLMRKDLPLINSFLLSIRSSPQFATIKMTTNHTFILLPPFQILLHLPSCKTQQPMLQQALQLHSGLPQIWKLLDFLL